MVPRFGGPVGDERGGGLGEALRAACVTAGPGNPSPGPAVVVRTGVSVVLAKQVRRYLDRDAELEAGKGEMRREMKFRSLRRHDGLTGTE